jgi:hypothetical protein
MKLTKGPDIEAHPPLFFELLQGDALYVIAHLPIVVVESGSRRMIPPGAWEMFDCE